MSIVSIIEIAALVVVIVFVVRLYDEVKRMRAAYNQQRSEFGRAISVIKELQQRQQESVVDAQREKLETLYNRIDEQEQLFNQGVAHISKTVDNLILNIVEA